MTNAALRELPLDLAHRPLIRRHNYDPVLFQNSAYLQVMRLRVALKIIKLGMESWSSDPEQTTRLQDSAPKKLVLPVIALATWLACAWIGRWSFRLPLRLAQRDFDLESCVQCGYWLKKLPLSSRNCPECGRPIVGESPFGPAA